MKTLMILVCKMHLVIKLHLTDSRVYREIDLVEMTYDQFFTHFVHPTFPPLVLTERDATEDRTSCSRDLPPHGAETELINVPLRYNDGALFERFGFSKNAFIFFKHSLRIFVWQGNDSFPH